MYCLDIHPILLKNWIKFITLWRILLNTKMFSQKRILSFEAWKQSQSVEGIFAPYMNKLSDLYLCAQIFLKMDLSSYVNHMSMSNHKKVPFKTVIKKNNLFTAQSCWAIFDPLPQNIDMHRSETKTLNLTKSQSWIPKFIHSAVSNLKPYAKMNTFGRNW